MTECSRCGDCCDPVVFTLSRGQVTADLADPYVAGRARRDLTFIADHWHLIGAHHNIRTGFFTYRCDKFDPEARLCTAYADRPPICSGFPWYGDEPRRSLTLSPRCSFQADVRTMLPIIAVT
jgi:Fe-S-cluster containining protein